MALGWHSRLYHLVSPTPIISTHQFIGIEIKTSRTPIQIFSVYLPSRSGCTDMFREALDNFNATMNSLTSISNTVVLGDFNADPGCHGGPLSTTSVNQQGRILSQCPSGISSRHTCTSLTSPPLTHSRVRLIIPYLPSITSYATRLFCQELSVPPPCLTTPSILLTTYQ